ncbi:pseudouridine synthase [Curtanaerobium respiraculi]|uniref:pseudouridine synthase n=1 Tax=Curtanaerobium respiraculi TaxID=2949669 RepID=UPI0024B3272D|nr:pseudouridine synthase [Curtanaerobium respiraculi]
MAEPMRLQRFLSRAGSGHSRRDAERLIAAGRVAVNGAIVDAMGVKVDPDVDEVALDGIVLALDAPLVTLALHKPTGFLSAMSDERKHCASELVPVADSPSLVHVGRLDLNTSGLLLFTTDGDLCNGLLHPSKEVAKTYVAHVQGVLDGRALSILRRGVHIETERHDYIASPAEVEVRSHGRRSSVLEITIHEGHYHQVRDMCKTIGHPVTALQRIRFGPVELGDLEPGGWRMLTEREVSALHDAAGIAR